MELREKSKTIIVELQFDHVAVHNKTMRIAIVDESATRAAVIREGLAAFDDCELFVVTVRGGLVAQIGAIAPTMSGNSAPH